MGKQFMDSYQAVLYILYQFSGIQIVQAICKVLGKEKVLQIIAEEVNE